MNPQAQSLNEVISSKNQAVFDLLSERGKNIFFPKKGILGQGAEAKGTRINATLGTAIEDDGTPMRLESISSKIDIDPAKAFLYAPSFGRPDIRKRWQAMIAEKNPDLKGNQRDYATINELICLSNMENINAVMINDGIPQPQRLKRLNEIAIHQMKVLTDVGGRNLLT
mgnify:CR=1 FL=1